MKTVGLLALVGAVCLTATPTISGKTHTSSAQPPEKFSVDVTVTGKAPRMTGGLSDVFLTFSAPVRVPKAELAAGTYVFTKLDMSAVRVMSADHGQMYATFLTVPALRTGDLDQAQIRFVRDAPGRAPRIVAIYPSGSSTGYEPIYSKRDR